mmetsp:Transcript_28901/g.66820  ORF Transcript_28901/g.66820 Transcript_28901/m.66820 type:complete len:309 (-) Transcript_28901:75-1001(-)
MVAPQGSGRVSEETPVTRHFRPPSSYGLDEPNIALLEPARNSSRDSWFKYAPYAAIPVFVCLFVTLAITHGDGTAPMHSVPPTQQLSQIPSVAAHNQAVKAMINHLKHDEKDVGLMDKKFKEYIKANLKTVTDAASHGVVQKPPSHLQLLPKKAKLKQPRHTQKLSPGPPPTPAERKAAALQYAKKTEAVAEAAQKSAAHAEKVAEALVAKAARQRAAAKKQEAIAKAAAKAQAKRDAQTKAKQALCKKAKLVVAKTAQALALINEGDGDGGETTSLADVKQAHRRALKKAHYTCLRAAALPKRQWPY